MCICGLCIVILLISEFSLTLIIYDETDEELGLPAKLGLSRGDWKRNKDGSYRDTEHPFTLIFD
jgi:hypothetical protein